MAAKQRSSRQKNSSRNTHCIGVTARVQPTDEVSEEVEAEEISTNKQA